MPYVIGRRRARADGADWYDGYDAGANCMTRDVWCDDDPVDTGILTPDGDPIMRVKDPVGFGIYPVVARSKRKGKGKGGRC